MPRVSAAFLDPLWPNKKFGPIVYYFGPIIRFKIWF